MDGRDAVKGDFLFDGDMENWAKFANSLRVISALRMSEVDPNTAKSEFNRAVSDPLGLITEDVMYPYLAETANENPWYNRWWRWAVTTTLVRHMKPLGDPRLDRYADPTGTHGEVMGMPYGINEDSAGGIPRADISFPGNPAARGQAASIAIMTRSQLLFSQAEAILRGWMDGNTQTMYEDAIKASWQQWGVMDDSTLSEFIAHQEVAWDENRSMELIMTQKWVALYLQGVEAWSEWRRTGLPELTPAPAPLNASGQIPRRQGYQLSEPLLNSENNEDALKLLGGPDNLDTKLWWDKE